MTEPYTRTVLPNGLTLISHPITSVNSVTIYAGIKAGPRYETEKTSGLAHFLEHMLFEGTNRFPSSKELARHIESVGGKSNAWTEKEYVVYSVKITNKHSKVAFDYLSDILFNSTLDEKAIEKEKKIVLEEMKRKTDTPEVEIWDLWLEWLWGKRQSLGRSTLGEENTVKNITKNKLLKYLNHFYTPSTIVLSIVGNLTIDEVKSAVLKYFGYIERTKKLPLFKKMAYTPKKQKVKLINAKTQQNQLILGFVTGVSFGHNDRYSMKVLVDILSRGVSSRLFHKLVYELGTAYSTGAGNWFFLDTGLFYIYGGFSMSNIEKATKVIAQELSRLKSEAVKDEELTEAKEKGKSDVIFSQETPDSLAYSYVVQELTEGRILTLDKILQKIDSVSADDIRRVAKKYLVPENLSLIIKGPAKENLSEESLNKLLADYFD